MKFFGVLLAGVIAAGFFAPHAHADQLSTLLSEQRIVDRIDNVSGYERSCYEGDGCVFGRAWNDPSNHTGCDTRNRVLAEQLHDVTFKADTHFCKVVAGWIDDPYTGQRVDVHAVQIDHVFPLKRAWNAGAAGWTSQRRIAFANDLSNLLAVSSKANEAKGDMGIGEWLPPRAEERCSYVLQYLTVAANYHLAITQRDRAAAVTVCPQGAT